MLDFEQVNVSWELNPITWLNPILAARKLEKFCKKWFVIKLCIFTSIDNEQVILFIILYLG